MSYGLCVNLGVRDVCFELVFGLPIFLFVSVGISLLGGKEFMMECSNI